MLKAKSSIHSGCVVASVLAISIGWISSVQASVAVPVANWTDSRSTPDGSGIFATPDWDEPNGGFKIAWNITESAGIYTYEYTITNSSDLDLAKALSHWNLQITDGAVLGDFSDFNILPEDGNPKVHEGLSMGNPGMPDDLYGFKWEDGGKTVFNSFKTANEPVWGDFYAKDGKVAGVDTIAYNTNFGTMPDDTTTDFTGWIARPNGSTPPTTPPPVVPIPAAVWMGLPVLAGLGIIERRKKIG